MSPEWMIAFDRMHATTRRPDRGSLSDPLEREEWRGLQSVSDLICRLLRRRGRNRPYRDGRQYPGRLPNGALRRAFPFSS
jgi:hypothetical protein